MTQPTLTSVVRITVEWCGTQKKEPAVLVLLGFAMIAVFMVLIMTKKLTPVLALIIVPTVFGLLPVRAWASGPWCSTR